MTIDLAAAIVSFEQTIEQLVIELENIDTYLADERNGKDLFTVGMRILGKDGTYSTFSGLRSVGNNGFNFSGTTPSTIFALDQHEARLNVNHFASQAHRKGVHDVDYQMVGLRRMLTIQRNLKADVLADMRKMVAEAKARAA